MKTAWEREQEKRQAKLELVREQVESGSLVIRKLALTIQHADSCTITFSGQLERSGHLELQMLGDEVAP